jgi:hypothetical protein
MFVLNTFIKILYFCYLPPTITEPVQGPFSSSIITTAWWRGPSDKTDNRYTNNISVISCMWSVLLVEETGVPGENHWPIASHWETLSHNVVLSTPHFSVIRTHNVDFCYLPPTITEPVQGPFSSSIITTAWWRGPSDKTDNRYTSLLFFNIK